VSLAIGAWASLFPHAWVGLFSDDAAVLESGSLYLRTVAPFYAFLAAGMALYFASQGAGQVVRVVLAGTARLLVVVCGSALAVSLAGIFAAVASGLVVIGGLSLAVVARARWR
jgi:Na+-driven multidrug efflux pump